MDVWDFREYQSATGRLPVSEWHEALSPGNQARADRFMRIARQLERLEMPYFRQYQELLEARWHGENNVPHRIFCDVPSGRRLIFLCGCTHKGRRYDPTNAYNTAVQGRKEIQNGRASTREFDF
jgi:hypothetical protein